MYLYLFMAAVAVFGTWLLGPYRTRAYAARWQQKPILSPPPDKAALRKYFGKLFVVVALLLGVIISTSSYSGSKTKSGIAAYNQGRYAAAEADLRQANNFSPGDAEPHYYLGLCLLHDGKKEAALSEFQSVCSVVAHERTTGPSDKQYAQEAQAEIQQLGGQ